MIVLVTENNESYISSRYNQLIQSKNRAVRRNPETSPDQGKTRLSCLWTLFWCRWISLASDVFINTRANTVFTMYELSPLRINKVTNRPVSVLNQSKNAGLLVTFWIPLASIYIYGHRTSTTV